MDIIIPPKRTPENDEGYFEILSKAVFQAGFSWKTVERKWFTIREAFQNFDFILISKWTQEDVLNCLDNPDVIRNIKKIEAIVSNAIVFEKIVKEFGGFKSYLESFRDEGYEYKVKEFTKRFSWLGRTGTFFFLYCINEDVPAWDAR